MHISFLDEIRNRTEKKRTNRSMNIFLKDINDDEVNKKIKKKAKKFLLGTTRSK